MILLTIIGRFVLVVDSVNRNSVRKIANCQRLLLFDRERPTLEFEETLKNFCCLRKSRKTTWCKFMRKLSVIVKTKTHIAIFLHWLQNSDYFTYIYSRRVLLFWQTEDVQN